jgi:predicted small metal-binding protein
MVKFCRCNALLSLALNEEGEGCRYVAKADTEQAVVDDMIGHMSKVHQVDATELVGNIKWAVKTTRR